MATETICGVCLTIAAAAVWWVVGIGPFVVWLALAAVAAPIVGKAIRSDDYFDIDFDDQSGEN